MRETFKLLLILVLKRAEKFWFGILTLFGYLQIVKNGLLTFVPMQTTSWARGFYDLGEKDLPLHLCML